MAIGAIVSPILAPTPCMASAVPLRSGNLLDNVPMDAGCHNAVPTPRKATHGTIQKKLGTLANKKCDNPRPRKLMLELLPYVFCINLLIIQKVLQGVVQRRIV